MNVANLNVVEIYRFLIGNNLNMYFANTHHGDDNY